jgi:outer membrane protein assembly factor BamB
MIFQYQKPNMGLIAFIFSLFVSALSGSGYYDWPMWRFDHNRSASTPEQLAGKLFLQWQVKYSPREPVWDDPLNQNLMQYDRIFEPIVAENKLFIGFNDQDKVLALDLGTGKELWHFLQKARSVSRIPKANGESFFLRMTDVCIASTQNQACFYGKKCWRRHQTGFWAISALFPCGRQGEAL